MCSKCGGGEQSWEVEGKSEDEISIGASYDMGWQKRGRGHNSLTGRVVCMASDLLFIVFSLKTGIRVTILPSPFLKQIA